jgi:ubiquinone/menaquinone biosynthesis C-methylase UbiE
MDAEAWDERYAATELIWSPGPNQFVEAECAGLTPGRALDLAAGEGRNALWLARNGWTVTAVDFSRVALEKGREVAGDVEVEWVVGDATAWSRDAAYDLAVVAYLQLVADERGAAIRNAFASLAPGGTLLVVAHDSSNLTEGHGGPQDAAVLYTADDVLGDLDGASYDVVRATRVERRVETEDGSATALDSLVRLVRRG